MREDAVLRHKDGRPIEVSVSVAPMYDDNHNLVGISAIISDIGERRARERHIEFLMREVSHRSKNLLAVVQAIAGQTARHSPSVEEFQARFSQRVAAMARSQDLLVSSNWAGATIADLVRLQLAPFTEEMSSRIEVSGPRLELKPDAVHSITLALHELATNAAKYGALSVPDGRVAVDWGLSGAQTSAGGALPHELARARRPAGDARPPRRASATSSSPRWSRARCTDTSRSTTLAKACCGPSTRRGRA